MVWLYNSDMKTILSGEHRLRTLLAAAGCALLATALLLAVLGEYKHFYELLVGGLVALQGAVLGRTISWRTYLVSFVAFLFLGILGDLFFGVFLTKLWYYNFTYWWEYVPLYIWAYPIAGIAMFQSYVLMRRLFKNVGAPTAKKHVSKRQLLVLGTAAVLLLPLTMWLAATGNVAVQIIHFIYITLLFVALFSYAAHVQGKHSLIDDLFKNPVAVGTSLLVITYGNLLLQELPNTRAWEWVYAGAPWQSVQLLHIPIVAFGGWLALSLVPVAWFYVVRDKEK